MSDRTRPTLVGGNPSGFAEEESDLFGTETLHSLLRNVFQKVSDSLAGPNRYGLDPVLSGMGADLETEPFKPGGTQSVDPDEWVPPTEDDPIVNPEDDFDPGATVDLPGSVETADWDLSGLPSPSEGKFVTNSKGYLVFTRGVGEAPANKANWQHPAYQARAKFVSQAYEFVRNNFDVAGAGQHRDHDAEVTANRSSNSDHYSSGAFDVRASSPAEAQRVLMWASTQDWVSFAQIYPDKTLVHISANIGMFTQGGQGVDIQGGGGSGTTLPSGEPAPTPAPEPPENPPRSNAIGPM